MMGLPGIENMLVLTRKISEAIVVGENIVVTVLDVRGDKVRLGVLAPREIAVDREEVAKAKKANPMPRSSIVGGMR